MKDMKTLLNEWKTYEKSTIPEEANPAELDPNRFPKELSRVSPKAAKILTRSGLKDQDSQDDVINVKHVPEGFPVKVLHPSQKSMNIKKAMQFVVNMLSDTVPDFKPGGDLGAFISKDPSGLFIMDGHHRWIATGMINPALKMGGYLVDFPGEELIAVLNAITKGRLNIQKGKPASGGFHNFNEGEIRKYLQTFVQKGVEWGTTNAADVLKTLEKYTGVQGEAAVEAATKKLVRNLAQLRLKTPDWAPRRPDMPVIDKDQVAAALGIAVNALKKGQVDVNEPYAQTGRKFMDADAPGKQDMPAGSEKAPLRTATDADEKRRKGQDAEERRRAWVQSHRATRRDSLREGEGKLKITQEELNKIIHEELENALNERDPYGGNTSDVHRSEDPEYGDLKGIEDYKPVVEDEELKEEDDWIQKAVDPKHKGYCTPMTKKTCTPERKALAKRFKKAAKKKEKQGGTGWQGKV